MKGTKRHGPNMTSFAGYRRRHPVKEVKQSPRKRKAPPWAALVRVCLADGSREAALQVRCKWLTGKIAEARFRTVVKEPFQQALTSNISCKAWQAKTQDCGLDGFAPR